MKHFNLDQHMTQWQNGELSHGEILGYLLEAQVEIQRALIAEETHEADARMERIGLAKGT
jgi:hypothetical protein